MEFCSLLSFENTINLSQGSIKDGILFLLRIEGEGSSANLTDIEFALNLVLDFASRSMFRVIFGFLKELSPRRWRGFGLKESSAAVDILLVFGLEEVCRVNVLFSDNKGFLPAKVVTSRFILPEYGMVFAVREGATAG